MTNYLKVKKMLRKFSSGAAYYYVRSALKTPFLESGNFLEASNLVGTDPGEGYFISTAGESQ